MDIGRAFSYPTRDPEWIGKVAIGAVLTLLSFIPILGWLVSILLYGYGMRVAKMVMEGVDDRLPNWDDWGGDLVRGFVVCLGSLIYFIPMLPFFCCIWLSSAIFSDSNGDMNFIGVMILCCFGSVIFAYSLVAIPMAIAAAMRYARNGEFGDAYLNFGQRFYEVRTHFGATVLLLVLLFIVQMVVSILGGITIWLCGLGLAFFWGGNLITAHLIGQYGMALDDTVLKAKNNYI